MSAASSASPLSAKSYAALSILKCGSTATQVMSIPWESVGTLNNQFAAVLPSLELDKSQTLNIAVTCTPDAVKLQLSGDPAATESLAEVMYVDQQVECNLLKPDELGLFSVEYDGVAGSADLESVGTQQD